MPEVVTHVLIALILASIVRDFLVRKYGKKIPLHYVLIVGVAAMLPDIDVAVYWILYWFGFTMQEVHRTFTHTIFFPLLFLILGFITLSWKNKTLGRHHLKVHTIFFMITLGVIIHLVLDATLAGVIRLFYPISNWYFGLNLVNHFPKPLSDIFLPSLDAALLILWIIYLEVKHKISDFI